MKKIKKLRACSKCRAGNPGDGGMPLSGGRCTEYCSFAGFCGMKNYESDGGVSCRPEATKEAEAIATPCTACKPGDPGDGGTPLTGGRCAAYCSNAGFCGNSVENYMASGGVDCRKQILRERDVAPRCSDLQGLANRSLQVLLRSVGVMNTAAGSTLSQPCGETGSSECWDRKATLVGSLLTKQQSM